MLNRIISCITLLFFFGVYVCGADNLFAFAGMYSTLGGTPIEDMRLTQQVNYVINNFQNEQNQVIIAHSQSGMRALGYAYQLKTRHADYPASYTGNVKGIIALDSPVLGYSPLLQGTSVLLDKIRNVKTRLVNGVSAVVEILFTPISYVGLEITLNGPVVDIIGVNTLTALLKLDKPWIEDLPPNNQFIKDNILPPWVGDQGHFEDLEVWYNYPNEDGNPDPSYGSYCVIEPVWVVDVPAHYDLNNTRFDSSLKVGFIVGQLNDPITFASPTGDVVSDIETYVRDGIAAANIVFPVAGGIHTAASSAYLTLAIVNFCCLDIPGGILFACLSASEGKMAYDCFSAYAITSDVPGCYGSILGSTANDGFILESDQTCDLAILGAAPADQYDNVKRVSSANHVRAKYHPETWGGRWDDYLSHSLDGNSNGSPNILPNGNLDIFLQKIDTSNRSSRLVQ